MALNYSETVVQATGGLVKGAFESSTESDNQEGLGRRGAALARSSFEAKASEEAEQMLDRKMERCSCWQKFKRWASKLFAVNSLRKSVMTFVNDGNNRPLEDGGVAAQLFVTFRGSLYSSTDDAADERRARPLFDMAGVWQLPGRRARHPPLCSSDWA